MWPRCPQGSQTTKARDHLGGGLPRGARAVLRNYGVCVSFCVIMLMLATVACGVRNKTGLYTLSTETKAGEEAEQW